MMENMKKYSRDEVFKESLAYFNGDSLAADVWINKYCLKDSDNNLYELTPDDMHRRIADELFRIESKYPNPIDRETIHDSIKGFKRIVPQGSPMAGIGNNFQVTSLSNCFVIGNTGDADSYGGIFKVDQEIAQLQKRRAGVGTDLSYIRPKGTPVKNSAITSTGIVPFMERHSNTTKEVAQDGRRGALMLSVSMKHPDVEDFIDAKLVAGKVTGANVSVRVDDEFMLAAKNNSYYVHTYPCEWHDYKENEKVKQAIIDFENNKIKAGELITIEKGKYVKFSDASKLWKKIIHNAWKSAEPGLLFWDTIIRESVPDCYAHMGFKTISTNPCLSGGSNLLTSEGYKTFEELDGKDVDIINSVGNVVPSKVWCSGEKETIELYNTLNEKIVCTEDHLWLTTTSQEVQAKDLHGLKIMPYLNNSVEYDNQYVELGLSTKINNNNLSITNYYDYSESQKKSYLRGLLTTNSKVGKRGITLKPTTQSTSTILIDMLYEHDINVKHKTDKNGLIVLTITKHNDNVKFYNLIGFANECDNKKLFDLIIEKSPKIRKIKRGAVMPVYDFIEPENHWGVVDGYISHNCGEITLSESDSCRLLALNLYGYVKNPFTKEAEFDWNLFKSDVIIAQRYMDDIIDLEIEKIDGIIKKIESDPEDEFIKMYELELWKRIKKAATNGRRTGLGITGEGDMLAALGYIYGTKESNLYCEKIHNTIKLQAYRSSVILAKERGAFPIYDSTLEVNNPFISRIKVEDPELYIDMMRYGRRNLALLTIAPTGSVSLLTQTTSGVEPAFMVVYKRRRKINPQEKNVKIDFVDDEGVSFQEYLVFHHNFETWLKVNGYDIDVVKSMTLEQVNEIVKKSPYYKATSNDVDWVMKVEMQGLIQKNVDHSISTTTNLPNDISEEMVAKVYESAWSSGCKGVTVYRDGSRSGVLVSTSEKKEKEKLELFREVHAPKRPKRLKGEVIRFQNNLEKWIGVVGLMDNRPYEIFTGKLENGLSNLPLNIKECEIVKNVIEVDGFDENNKPIKIRKKRYDIEYVDQNGEKCIHTGLNHAFNPEYWNYAKLISGSLRHGMPLVYVFDMVNSLNLRDNTLNTWKNGIARVIKRYVKEGEKVKGRCSECGGEDFMFQEGCLRCISCGWSKCS